MRVLISFCNQKNESNRDNLICLDVFSGEEKRFGSQLDSMFKNDGFTGIGQNKEFIFAAYNRGVAVFKKDNFELFANVVSNELSDAHSMAVDGNRLFVVSTGKDQVREYLFNNRKKRIDFSKVVWFPPGSNQEGDSHHLNSLFLTRMGNLYVSGFGPKEGQLWSSAKKGYIYNITKKKKEVSPIYHPHSVFVKGEKFYYCESSTKSVKVNKDSLIKLDSGYTRGLALKEDYLFLGTSTGRKSSKSQGIVNNPADPGLLIKDCRLLTYKKKDFFSKNYELLKEISFVPDYQEIYDIIVLN